MASKMAVRHTQRTWMDPNWQQCDYTLRILAAGPPGGPTHTVYCQAHTHFIQELHRVHLEPHRQRHTTTRNAARATAPATGSSRFNPLSSNVPGDQRGPNTRCLLAVVVFFCHYQWKTQRSYAVSVCACVGGGCIQDIAGNVAHQHT